jgi:hypothetical protein
MDCIGVSFLGIKAGLEIIIIDDDDEGGAVGKYPVTAAWALLR